ncbi:MAG: serine/threonine protein kinase, partial [Polyangiaceae bacterium]|nr:serine/threonine protein kinase [Polyangiaceae bacterium]
MPECRSCRSQNPEEAAYCLRCGTKLETKRAHALAETLPCDMTSHKDRTIAATPSDRAMYAGAINAGAINSPAQVSPVPVIGHLSTGHMVDGKYAISSVLGGGAMGTVYLATDVNTNTRVVVKAIRPEYADRPDFRTRILAEGRALARIDHANVVRLNAVVVGPTDLYLVMQYVDGESLDRTIERYVQRMEYMPVDVALGFFEQVLEGVGAAHEEDLIHRDIKPGNIMVRRKDMKVKVTDFGIVKEEETIKSEQGVTRGIIGTLLYMAPEQITALQPLDRRVDIYALGILLYEMLACRVPFAGQSDFETMMMHLNSQVPSLSRIRNDVPRFIDAIIQKACAKDRNQRFSTTSEMSAALRAARGHAVVQPVQPVLPLPLVPPVPVVSGDSNKISIGRWALAGGLMVCVCIGVGAMWILSQLSMGASAEMPAGS